MKLKGKMIKCSATNCPSTKLKDEKEEDGADGSTVQLFSFPTENKTRCRQWVSKTGSRPLKRMATAKLQSNFLCSRHFEDDQFSNDEMTVLKETAIPTIFETPSTLLVANWMAPKGRQAQKGRVGGRRMKTKAETMEEDCGHDSDEDSNSNDSQPDEEQGEVDDHQDLNDTVPTKGDDGDPDHKRRQSHNTHCQWCSAINCSNNRIRQPNLSFFRLPTDPERGRKWLVNSQRFDLLDKSYKTLHNMFCAEHFQAECIINKGTVARRRRLFRWAVPTVFNFSVPKKLRGGKKPIPTYPACASQDKDRGRGSDKRPQKNSSTRAARYLKRNHQEMEASEEPELCKTETERNRKPATVKELKKENLSLTEHLSQLLQSRVEMMRRLEELEGIVGTVQEHARIDVGLLKQALDPNKHPDAQPEFEKLSSVIRLLSTEEEVGEHNGMEDDISSDSLD